MTAARHIPLSLAPAVLALVVLPACGGEGSTPAGDRAAPAVASAAGGRVVARVNDAPILEQDLRHQLRGMPAGQRDPRRALEQLVRAELLAQEAVRRGLDREPAVRTVRRRAAANLLIRQEFRRSFGKEQVPRELIERAFETNRIRYQHPDICEVVHLVALADNSHTKQFHVRAYRLAARARKLALQGELSKSEFEQLAAYVGKYDPAVTFRAETLSTPRRGFTVAAFGDAACDLKQPGDISEVVQTRYGYHVIYFISRNPAKHLTLDQVEDEIRDKVFEQARTQGFELWIKRLLQRHDAEVHRDRIQRAFTPRAAASGE